MELGPSTFVGVGLAFIGFILYFIKTKKPDVSRDYDLFFSSVGLLCGGILIFQGWRLDPILLLCQILSSATAIFFIGESLWLRSFKSKNMKNFSSKIPYEKKQNTFLTIESFGKSHVSDEEKAILFQNSKDKKVFFFDYPQKNINRVKKALILSENYNTKDLNEINQNFFLKNEKKNFKKYKMKNLNLKFDYTQPIDYFPISLPPIK
jgi:hypothetical protein